MSRFGCGIRPSGHGISPGSLSNTSRPLSCAAAASYSRANPPGNLQLILLAPPCSRLSASPTGVFPLK